MPYKKPSAIDDEFGVKLDLHLFSYYVNLLMKINQKRDDRAEQLCFYLYFYLQEKTGQNLLEKWRFEFSLDETQNLNSMSHGLRALASLSLQMPFNKNKKTHIVSHTIKFDDEEKIPTPESFSKLKLSTENMQVSVKYQTQNDFSNCRSTVSTTS